MSAPYNPDDILDRVELAARLRLKPRGVDCLVKAGTIPCIHLSRKLLRFHWGRVLAAMQRLEEGGDAPGASGVD